MKIYQLHLNGKDRAKHNFRSIEEAKEHQERLIRYTVDRISEGQLGYRKYLTEAKDLEIVELEKKIRTRTFSVCEYGFRCSGVVKSFNSLEAAEAYMYKLQEDSTRYYAVMKSTVND